MVRLLAAVVETTSAKRRTNIEPTYRRGSDFDRESGVP
jgi:hypothetical protein